MLNQIIHSLLERRSREFVLGVVVVAMTVVEVAAAVDNGAVVAEEGDDVDGVATVGELVPMADVEFENLA